MRDDQPEVNDYTPEDWAAVRVRAGLPPYPDSVWA